MFGLFGLAGKFSAVIGPIAFGTIVFLLVDSAWHGRLPDRDPVPAGADGPGLVDRARRAGASAESRRGGPGRSPTSRSWRRPSCDMTLVVAHRGAVGPGPREHARGVPAGGGCRRGCDRARRSPHLRRGAGRDPRRHPGSDDRPDHDRGHRDHGRPPNRGRGLGVSRAEWRLPVPGEGADRPDPAPRSWPGCPLGWGLRSRSRRKSAADAVVEALAGSAVRGRGAGHGHELPGSGHRPGASARPGSADRAPARAR